MHLLAFAPLLACAGCASRRASVDRRVAEEIRTGTAKFGASYKGGGKGIIDSPRDVGGWPELRSLPAPIDTDHDGMPTSGNALMASSPTIPPMARSRRKRATIPTSKSI